MESIKYYGNVPKSWKDWAEKHADKIEEVGQEDNNFNGDGRPDYWVYLRSGWVRGYGEQTHQFHECSLKEVKALWYQVQKEETPNA